MSGSGTNKTAVITGAAQGIGLALARRFAKDGYRIVIADQNDAKGPLAAAAIVESGGQAMFVQTDVTDEPSCQSMARIAMEACGSIDVLINNAGIVNAPRAAIWELSVSEWDRMMAVNARGVWLVTKCVIPALRESGGGSIVNMSSNTWLSGRAGIVHYVASKAAVVGITRTAARELGPFNIRVNCIMPGSTITAERRERGYDQARANELIGFQAIKHEETPDDIVGVAAFLASEDARFITGQSINVDGGYLFQ
jgi:3-oxoacyl-[acyl-carrier protein] reductase